MSPRENAKIRKPAVKKKKSAWELHKDTIIRLYKDKTLEEVAEEMEESYGFRANKRQYVYRLSEWKARKYNSPPPEQDHSQNSGFLGLDGLNLNHDIKPVPSSLFRGQASPLSPTHDVEQIALDSTDENDFNRQWLVKMKPRGDALLVLPRNHSAFDNYIKLQQKMPSEDKTGSAYRAIVDACVFSALTDTVDPTRKDRIGTTRTILAELANLPCTGGVDRLRRRLQLHAVQTPVEGGKILTMKMLEGFRLASDDLNMFLLVILFYSDLVPTAIEGERIMGRYIQGMRQSKEAFTTLFGGIEWCKSICNNAALEADGFNIHCSNPNERVQLNMAKVSSFLFTKLLSDEEELPSWAQNIEDTLGISRTTFAITLVCMAWDYSELCSFQGLEPTPYHRVHHGLNMLTAIQPPTIWHMFLRAFVQVHKVAYTGHIHTFASTAEDQSPCSEGFINQLNNAVSALIGDCQLSEFSETTSVSNGPFTPSSTQDSYFSPEMNLFSPEDEAFGGFGSDFNITNTFESGKGLADYLQLDASHEMCME